jgi:hypothetical protein
MDELIYKLCDLLNGTRWGIGASKLLWYYGITKTVHDLDISVDLKDHDEVCRRLRTIGKEIGVPKKDQYLTSRFSRFEVDGIEIDLMSEMKIKHSNGVYTYTLDIVEERFVNDRMVPLSSLEQWYICYQLLEGREAKVDMLEKYFRKVGQVNSNLLEKYLFDLPIDVQDRTKKIIRDLQ